MKDYNIKKIFVSPFYKKILLREINLLLSDYDFSYGSSYSTWYNNCFLQENRFFFPLVDKIKKKMDYNINITEMWGNVNFSGSKVKLHNHKNKVNSGVIYLKKPKNSGNIIIDNNIINVNENDILFFNSSKMHETEINLSNEKRVVVSFNYNEV